MCNNISKARGHFSKEAQANPRQAPLRTQKHHSRLTRGETRGMEMWAGNSSFRPLVFTGQSQDPSDLWAAHKTSPRRFLKLPRPSLILLEPLYPLPWLLQSHPRKARSVNKIRLSGLLIRAQHPQFQGTFAVGMVFRAGFHYVESVYPSRPAGWHGACIYSAGSFQ